MKMWIARDEDGALFIFKDRPFLEDDGEQKIWVTIGAESCIGINCKLFPEVTFENSPQEVELNLKADGLESNYSKLLASEFAHALVEKMKEAFKIECK